MSCAPRASDSGPEPEAAPSESMPPQERLAKGLGGFSLVLGIPPVAMPGRLARFVGVVDDGRSRAWTRVVGVRELVAAAGILGRRRPVAWLWARVAGDVMDLTLLGIAFAAKDARRNRIMAVAGAVAGVLGLDALAAVATRRASKRAAEDRAVRVKAAVTVRRSREDVYRFWHDFQNLPHFMDHLEAVEPRGNGRSRWMARGPAGRTVEWEAELIEDRSHELIKWRSATGAQVQNEGRVEFTDAPGGRGTELRLDMSYAMPGGVLGATVAKLLGAEPERQVDDDLRRFKQVMETGMVIRSEGSPDGTTVRRLLKQRPAQPLPRDAAKTMNQPLGGKV